MKIIDLQNGGEYVLKEHDAVSCAIGNFDGVHLGHRQLLAVARKKGEGITKSAVWTFDEPSSRKVSGVSLLTAPCERFEIFRSLGIELLFLTNFDEIRSLAPDQFVKDILYRDCHVRRAICGFNFHYGKMAKGNAEMLKASMTNLGAQAEIVPPFCINGVTVSSSEIRAALSEGDPEKATKMLARPYSLTSEVVHGKELGRNLGFPTANQRFPENRALPRFGVYAVRVRIDDIIYGGVANIGVRPTVEHTKIANCETFILGWNGDLYGKTVTTEFCKFLRPEQHFEGIDALKEAVQRDISNAVQYFKAEKEQKI